MASEPELEPPFCHFPVASTQAGGSSQGSQAIQVTSRDLGFGFGNGFWFVKVGGRCGERSHNLYKLMPDICNAEAHAATVWPFRFVGSVSRKPAFVMNQARLAGACAHAKRLFEEGCCC